MADIRKSSRIGSFVSGIRKAIPLGIHPILRRFWDFTKKNSREFAKHLHNPEEKEDKFIKEVVKKFKG